MPSQAANKPPSQANEGSRTHTIDVQAYRAFVNSDSFPNIQNLCEENGKLKKRIAALATTNDTNRETLTDLTQELREERNQRDHHIKGKDIAENELRAEKATSNQLRRDVKELDGRVQAQLNAGKKKDLEISHLRNDLDQKAEDLAREKEATDRLNKELQATQSQLHDSFEELHHANAALASIQSFVVNLGALADRKTQIQEASAGTFRKALDFFQSTLYCDIDEDLFAAGCVHDRSLPLPASNTHIAKQMRVVAGLMVCGKALDDHVYRATYVTGSKDDGLDRALQRLASQNPRQEAYLRAVLLKVLPEDQQRSRERSIEQAVQQVSAAVGKWSRNADSFESGLQSVCLEASNSWQLVLEVEDRIMPEFTVEVGSEWQQLPTIQAPASSRAVSTGQAKAQVRPQKQQAGPAPTTTQGALTRNKVANVVWPAFLAAASHAADDAPDDPPVVPVHRGYVLTKAQVQDAEEEISREESTHRLARQGTRRTQLSDPKKRRNSAGFLSTQ